MNPHPSVDTNLLNRWRLIKNGGDDFVEEFLLRRSEEEDFATRRSMSYDPATASSAIWDVVNSLAARLDITRTGGSEEYQNIVAGKGGGVDRNGSSMNDFIIRETAPELCFMSKVCWFVKNFTDEDDPRKYPWIEQFPAESIYNWTYKDNQLVYFAAKYNAIGVNEETGEQENEVEVVRTFRLVNGLIETKLQLESDIEVDVETLQPGDSTETIDLDEIPVILMELPEALLSKIDKIQIAVLNMESADVNWLRNANITVYVEQGLTYYGEEAVLSDDETVTENKNEIKLGSTQGRKYPLGANQPNFISPPADSLRASMEKQKYLDKKVREILNTTLSDLTQASAESLGILGQGREAGLFTIGSILNLGESAFSRIFHKYQNRNIEPATVNYPRKYELRTEDERLKKAKEIKDIAKTFGSNTIKKLLELDAARTLLEGRVTHEQMKTIEEEIMNTEFCIYDPDTVNELVTSGLISRSLASKSLGAPENDSKEAEQEHIRRIVAVQVSQTSGTGELGPDSSEAERVRREAIDEIRNTGDS